MSSRPRCPACGRAARGLYIRAARASVADAANCVACGSFLLADGERGSSAARAK